MSVSRLLKNSEALKIRFFVLNYSNFFFVTFIKPLLCIDMGFLNMRNGTKDTHNRVYAVLV